MAWVKLHLGVTLESRNSHETYPAINQPQKPSTKAKAVIPAKAKPKIKKLGKPPPKPLTQQKPAATYKDPVLSSLRAGHEWRQRYLQLMANPFRFITSRLPFNAHGRTMKVCYVPVRTTAYAQFTCSAGNHAAIYAHPFVLGANTHQAAIYRSDTAPGAALTSVDGAGTGDNYISWKMAPGAIVTSTVNDQDAVNIACLGIGVRVSAFSSDLTVRGPTVRYYNGTPTSLMDNVIPAGGVDNNQGDGTAGLDYTEIMASRAANGRPLTAGAASNREEYNFSPGKNHAFAFIGPNSTGSTAGNPFEWQNVHQDYAGFNNSYYAAQIDTPFFEIAASGAGTTTITVEIVGHYGVACANALQAENYGHNEISAPVEWSELMTAGGLTHFGSGPSLQAAKTQTIVSVAKVGNLSPDTKTALVVASKEGHVVAPAQDKPKENSKSAFQELTGDIGAGLGLAKQVYDNKDMFKSIGSGISDAFSWAKNLFGGASTTISGSTPIIEEVLESAPMAEELLPLLAIA